MKYKILPFLFVNTSVGSTYLINSDTKWKKTIVSYTPLYLKHRLNTKFSILGTIHLH